MRKIVSFMAIKIIKMSERQTQPGNLANLQNLHSLIHLLWTCWRTFVFISMLKSHSHTLSLFLTLALFQSLIHSLSTCSSLCSKVAVYSRKMQWFFFYILRILTLSCEFRGHKAGSQLTKVVHHVPMINISIWHLEFDIWHICHFSA